MTAAPLDDQYLRLHPLPRHSEGDKHSRGRVLVIAGHLDLPGAALLAGLGALRAGAGVLRIATCRTNAPHLGVAMPEAMVIGCSENSAGEIAIQNGPRLLELTKNSDAVLMGPGTEVVGLASNGRDAVKVATAIAPDVVGVNARDLATFATDLEALARLAPEIPTGPVRLAESGIRTRDDVERLSSAGFQAFLVGESLLRSEDPEDALRALTGA